MPGRQPSPKAARRQASPKGGGRGAEDRRRGLMGAAVDAPLRAQAGSTHPSPQLAAKAAADKLEAEHRKRALLREQEALKMAQRHADKKEQFRLKREKQVKLREAAERKLKDDAASKARRKAMKAAEAERQSKMAHDVDARARMQRVLDAEEHDRMRSDPEARLRALKHAWKAARKARKAMQRPTDHYAEWRNMDDEDGEEELEEEEELDGSEDTASEDEDDEELERDLRAATERVASGGGMADLSEEGEMMTEEARILAEVRAAKYAERDLAVQKIIAQNPKDDPKTLREALGLTPGASDAEVERSLRKMLRLLHPDYSLNLSIKGTRQHGRIEAAFKRLNGLREAEAK